MNTPPVPNDRWGIFPSLLISSGLAGVFFIIATRFTPVHTALELGLLLGNTALFATLFFFMLASGRTDRYRFWLFSFLVFNVCIAVIHTETLKHGSIFLNDDTFLNCETPFCPLAIPATVLPALFSNIINFPGHFKPQPMGIGIIILTWLLGSLIAGRGWCGWLCPFGGLEETFARLPFPKKIRYEISRRWFHVPTGILIATILTSGLTWIPMYCELLCPFKPVTAFRNPTNWFFWLETLLFGTLFLVTVVILPWLTKRRIQCQVICPLGVVQTLWEKINPFKLRIHAPACTRCRKCFTLCPNFALDDLQLSQGQPGSTCSKCGRCVDHCPSGAIAYHIAGASPEKSRTWGRLLFLMPTYLLLWTMLSPFVLANESFILAWMRHAFH